MNTIPTAPSEREEIEMLLPWYITGKLDRADREKVASYLEHHPEMALQVDLAHQEQQETVSSNEAIRLPSARALDELMARVDQEPKRSISRQLGRIPQLLSEFFTFPSANAVRWAAAAAVVVVMLQAVTIGALMTNRSQTSTYQTASGQTDKHDRQGTFVLVRFAADASAQDIANALENSKFTIVDGPKPGGFFIVRISAKVLNDAERNEFVSQLRSKKSIFSLVTLAR